MNKDLKYTGDVIDGSSGDMSQERSGIYQDRVNGKLPMDRVKGHYQMRDDKMAQMKERALQKSAQKKADMEAERIRVANLPEVKQLTEQELEELIFSIDGDKPEKTMRTSNNNGQKKKKKKGKKK